MKILLTGANGQVGRCFWDVIAQAQENDSTLELLACGSAELDITDNIAVSSLVNEYVPDIIVNAAAYTAVDKAEAERERAFAVNELGPKYLAEAAAKIQVPIIHISTDYVFDGEETKPYQVGDKVNPQSVYGASKLAGEKAVIGANPRHVIIRTAWVFSEYGNNFVKTMVKLAQSRDKLGIVADQYGCPTYAGDIAHAIFEICTYIANDKATFGIYHYCGDSPTSWHGFARAIFADAVALKLIEKSPELRAINTDEYPVPATRPKYSVMDNSKLTATYDLPASAWRSALRKVLLTQV